MTGTQRSHRDDERLAQRLREIDPARGVAPLSERHIEEIIMTSTPETSAPTPSAAPPSKTRRRLVVAGLAAAAAAAIVAAVVVVPLVVGQPRGGDTLALSLPDPTVSAMCAPVTAEYIGNTDVAFEGRVTGIDGTTVTVEVLSQYTGPAASTVTIPQGTDIQLEETTGPFELGGTYLISAVDGVVTTCGMSGPSTPELKALYDAAF